MPSKEERRIFENFLRIERESIDLITEMVKREFEKKREEMFPVQEIRVSDNNKIRNGTDGIMGSDFYICKRTRDKRLERKIFSNGSQL